MSDLLRSPSVRAWAYGHTHFNNDQVMHGARVLSNQRGYPSAQHQPSSSRYSNAMVVEIFRGCTFVEHSLFRWLRLVV